VRALTAVGAAVLLAAGPACSRSHGAAEKVQDACIEVLSPFTRDRTPSAAQLSDALARADSAARSDPRWAPVHDAMVSLAEAMNRRGDIRSDIDRVAGACRRANDEVKRHRYSSERSERRHAT
jgi:hypothetical protein